MLENYKHKYPSRGKFIFVPTPECDRRGERLLRFGEHIGLPPYFFHYRRGGHVEALHQHIESRYFFRIDLKNFFYSISRNRVSRILRQRLKLKPTLPTRDIFPKRYTADIEGVFSAVHYPPKPCH
jgi:hypothetical protein